MDPEANNSLAASQSEELLPYEPPTVTTYTDEQLLEALGPAQAGGTYTTFPPP